MPKSHHPLQLQLPILAPEGHNTPDTVEVTLAVELPTEPPLGLRTISQIYGPSPESQVVNNAEQRTPKGREKPKLDRRHLSHMGRMAADGPPQHVREDIKRQQGYVDTK
jgi:hypothetical protein